MIKANAPIAGEYVKAYAAWQIAKIVVGAILSLGPLTALKRYELSFVSTAHSLGFVIGQTIGTVIAASLILRGVKALGRHAQPVSEDRRVDWSSAADVQHQGPVI
jgi:hypothetical protein